MQHPSPYRELFDTFVHKYIQNPQTLPHFLAVYAMRVPGWIKDDPIYHQSFFSLPDSTLEQIKERLRKFRNPAVEPLVSVVIPAWNEEETLHRTIYSLANNVFSFDCELIVINNNSTDRTQEIVDALGVLSFAESRQGIGFARQTGLENARGRYLLTCDSDTIYPSGWIETMAGRLQINEPKGVVAVKGTYSFIPSKGNNRLWMTLYEILGDLGRKIRYRSNRRYLTVLGFNFGFIREKALAVNGFIIEKQRVGKNIKGTPGFVAQSEDGTLAGRLTRNGGKLLEINDKGAHVWTSDRRLMYSGNLLSAFFDRIRICLKDVTSGLLKSSSG